MLITGSVFSFISFIIYAWATLTLIFSDIEIWRKGYSYKDCVDESYARAMLSGAVVGCLIASIGTLGAFVSSICASCRLVLEVQSRYI